MKKTYYTESHEWIEVEKDGIATVGITDRALQQLGDIVYIQPPQIGQQVRAGEEIVVVESTKSAIDIYAPLSGKVLEINTAFLEQPETLASSSEERRWLYKLKIKTESEVD